MENLNMTYSVVDLIVIGQIWASSLDHEDFEQKMLEMFYRHGAPILFDGSIYSYDPNWIRGSRNTGAFVEFSWKHKNC